MGERGAPRISKGKINLSILETERGPKSKKLRDLVRSERLKVGCQ